jgi:NADH-quinone oxidoreductase subunit H
MFFLASYANLFIYSLLGAIVFLGGWDWPLGRSAGLGLQLVWIFGKTSFLILLIMWIRFTLPRLRIDQLMSYCWKVLIPLAFLQVFLNGLVLVYDWPDIFLLLTSGAGLALAGYIIYRSVRVDRRVVRLVPAHGAAPAPASTGAGGSG